MQIQTLWYFWEGGNMHALDMTFLQFMEQKVRRTPSAMPPEKLDEDDLTPLFHWLGLNGYSTTQQLSSNLVAFLNPKTGTYLLIVEVLNQYHLIETDGLKNLLALVSLASPFFQVRMGTPDIFSPEAMAQDKSLSFAFPKLRK